MTQQRHIEAANKIVDDELAAYYVSPRPGFHFDLREAITIALADAENRAAWDGWDTRHRWSNESFQERWHKIEDDFAAKYGPRPSRGEVGHE